MYKSCKTQGTHMKKILLTTALALLLTACDDDKPAVRLEAEATIPADAHDYFNHMGLHDTRGSKGQVRLSESGETVWFDSARTLLTYLRLPETANQPLAAWVSTHDSPAHWLAVKDAWLVQTPQAPQLIGKDDYIPFADQASAEKFAGEHQGKVLRAGDISEQDLQL